MRWNLEHGASGKSVCHREQCASSLLLLTGSFPCQWGAACSALAAGASFPLALERITGVDDGGPWSESIEPNHSSF